MLSSNFVAIAQAADLSPYTGRWTRVQAAHLLRRATFSPNRAEIDEAMALGLNASLDRLFETIPLPGGPVFYNYDGHPEAGIGDPWAGLYVNPQARNDDSSARSNSLTGWCFLTAAETSFNIRERMVLFWTNHFGIGRVQFHTSRVRVLNRYREYATGNFRELIKEMTIDPYMLQFLNGNKNSRRNPNENYAREILELYTIGKGPQVAPGDYTNYTEQDVAELARAFTGWVHKNVNTSEPGAVEYAEFVPNRHDRDFKILSERFNFSVIENADEEEYANVVDLIFKKDEVARYISRKLYRHFCYFDITPEVEANVIEPMARLIINNDYVLGPAIRRLLGSAHFYQNTFIGAMIKSPMDFALSLHRKANFYDQDTIYNRYRAARSAYVHAKNEGMDLLNAPTVAGWKAFYQVPSFHKLWLNVSTLKDRIEYARTCTKSYFRWEGDRFPVDWLSVVDTLSDPYDAESMIHDMAELLLPRKLTSLQFTYIQDLLLDGQEDFVWSEEYGHYRANPNDEMSVRPVNRRLKEMIYGIAQLPEFQLY